MKAKVVNAAAGVPLDNQTRSNFLKRIMFALAMTLLLGPLTIQPAASQIGPDSCKNVKFQFVNNLPDGEIVRIKKVEYHHAVKDNWRTEVVSFPGNGECANGEKCTTTGDNLADSKGVRLDTFKLHYQWRLNQNGANWSDTIISPLPFNEATGFQECTEGKTYGGMSWVVTK
jgi:hypothetical protein